MIYDSTLAVLLGVGGLCAAGVVSLALSALVQRRSWPYLLVALALGALLVRVVAGVGYMHGSLSPETHHLLEHGLDVAMAALVIAAVAFAREASAVAGGEAR